MTLMRRPHLIPFVSSRVRAQPRTRIETPAQRSLDTPSRQARWLLGTNGPVPNWSFSALAALLLAAAAPASAALQPADFGALAFRQHPGATVPGQAVLRDEAGRPLALGSLFGERPAVLVLDYLECPNLCGLVLSGLVHDLAAAGLTPGRDVEFIAVSFDPTETPANAERAKASYLRLFGEKAGPDGWHFLTGAAPQVRRVADAVGFRYRWDESIGQYAHPAGFVVLTPEGRISRYMLGFEHSPQDLKAALAEAGQGAVEPPAHPLLLLCFGYDPQQGTIAYTAMRALRWAALAAAAALGIYMVAAFRRERAR